MDLTLLFLEAWVLSHHEAFESPCFLGASVSCTIQSLCIIMDLSSSSSFRDDMS